jgi:hypothetical protein
MFNSTVERRFRLFVLSLMAVVSVGGTAAAQTAPAQTAAPQSAAPQSVDAQGVAVPGDPTVDLVLVAGRSMRVALDHRTAIHHVGQTVTGTLMEPVYVYDRIVLPVGCKLTGHIDSIENPSKKKRTLAYANGDFSPHPQAVLKFDSIEDLNGHTIRLDTTVKGGMLRAKPQTAKNSKSEADGKSDADGKGDAEGKGDADGEQKTSRVDQAKEAMSAQAHQALALLKDPGKKERLEAFAINELPYHPQYLDKGMVYDVLLVEPVNFGQVEPAALAPPGTLPAPDSVLKAKFATTITSAKTERGAPIEAVLTQPVFSAQHQLILPEGAKLTGEVTQAKQARHWHHNGQLRVLFESVQAPAQQASEPLRAQLYSVDAASKSGVTVDEEGGTTIANSKTRFVAPALSVLALRGSTHQDHEMDIDPGETPHMVAHGNPGAKAVGGMFGFSGIGAIASQFYRPLAIGLSFYGASKTVYRNVIAKGSEVTFNADTPIQVRLAPGPSPAKKPDTPPAKK